MSLKKNILANYLSQIYVSLIAIVVLPMYLQFMGAEVYGLVGFYSMLQVWFGLLDLGLTPTVARQTALYCAKESAASDYRLLIRTLEFWFVFVAVVGGAALYFLAPLVASDWLQGAQISVEDRVLAVELMAFIIAARWLSGIYRGIIAGFERQIWLAGFTSAIATLRFLGVLPIMAIFGGTAKVFFSYQVCVALIEAACILYKAYTLLPPAPSNAWLGSYRVPAALRSALRFSLVIAFTSAVWVLVTQIDKLILSGILPLAEYGHYTLAVLVASGVNIVSGPVSTVIMPRMARLNAENDHVALIRVYRQATQLVTIIAGAVAITLVLTAELLLRHWTGDSLLAREAAPILQLYAAGNGILAVCAFPYYLQYAKGDLRLHLLGNLMFVVVLVPAIIYAASRYGAIGAGCVWLVTNGITFVVWLPFVHSKLEIGLNRRWYTEDTLAIGVASLLVGFAIRALILELGGANWGKFSEVALIAASVLLTAIFASSTAREVLRARIGVMLRSL